MGLDPLNWGLFFRLPNFVNSKKMAEYVGHELKQKLENPLIFQLPPLGIKAQPPIFLSLCFFPLPIL